MIGTLSPNSVGSILSSFASKVTNRNNNKTVTTNSNRYLNRVITISNIIVAMATVTTKSNTPAKSVQEQEKQPQ